MEKNSICSSVTFLFLFLMVSSIIPIAYSQQGNKPLPVLLIHGYLNDNSVWDEWVDNLETDGFNVQAVKFDGNDKCGSAADHAKQLKKIVEDFKISTGSDKINIVGHSKGGLDARVYLANNPSNDDVANLIMIGTPNAGSPRAENRDPEVINNANWICSPFSDQAINDLIPGSTATQVKKNNHTQYHTIAGDWKNIPEFCTPAPIPAGCVPFDNQCRSGLFSLIEYQREGSKEIKGPDDGLVPLKSVESGGFHSLGHTDNCHTNLFTDEELEKAMTILNP